MPAVSVIVPVYNSERYLQRCVDSILGQTLHDIELILIDDGSIDGSGELCDAYADKDSRVRTVHKENGGAASARNKGIAIARGDYVGFVDSDDYIEPDMYGQMYGEALQNGAQLILCDGIKESAGGQAPYTGQPLREGFYTKEQMYREYFPCLLMREEIEFPPTISNCLCLVKRSLLETHALRYDEGAKYCEDSLFGSLIAYYADSFCYLKHKYLYHYCFNASSTTHTPHLDKWDVFQRIIGLSRAFFSQAEDYDFTLQLSVQAIYFAFNAINELRSSDLPDKEKRERIRNISSSEELKTAWEGFRMPENISFKLKIRIFLLKHGLL